MKLWHRKRPGWKVWKWGEWREALEQRRRYKKYNRPGMRRASKLLDKLYQKGARQLLETPLVFTGETKTLSGYGIKTYSVGSSSVEECRKRIDDVSFERPIRWRSWPKQPGHESKDAFAALCNKGCPR